MVPEDDGHRRGHGVLQHQVAQGARLTSWPLRTTMMGLISALAPCAPLGSAGTVGELSLAGLDGSTWGRSTLMVFLHRCWILDCTTLIRPSA